jgi:hypothetical protein
MAAFAALEAVRRREPEALQRALQADARAVCAACDDDGVGILSLAAASGFSSAVDALLAAGADVRASDNKGRGPHASPSRRPLVVRCDDGGAAGGRR